MTTITITITAAKFETLKSQAARVENERDVEYSHETLFDEQDREIAFASYHSYRGAEYKQHSEPRPAPAYDEDGNQIDAA